ncbi:dihydrodipicolinate synthase [Micrococcus luteus]|uniref:dihydrodipicolinate synthase family protein n=1 Tax=Micrococcus TaxID=1269 RepID=UPI00059708B7|nr:MULTISPECIES: dihydrodipicolinate synthase family protein [Micrococcus]KIK86586.1 dihydrodipicolinate synthase [Micrococcus luteus]MCF8559549.1 dihydrodipicolinate synthase family protein [Micrococcus yunnanensis]
MEFPGLNAYLLTPLRDGRPDPGALERLAGRAVRAGVDAVAVLGSTGVGAYLGRADRAETVRRAVAAAGPVPVLAGVSALRTEDAVRHAEDAAAAGAAGLLLSAMTYQPLTEDEVVGLFADVGAATGLPVVLYDNPTTTHVAMTERMYTRVAAAAPVHDVKIPGRSEDDEAATRARVGRIRAALPPGTGVGVSGDAVATAGLLAGCDAWHSVLGGTLPRTAASLTRDAAAADEALRDRARDATARLEPLWAMMRAHGSLRVMAAVAAHLGLADVNCLPRPLRPLAAGERGRCATIVTELGLD